MQEHVKTVGRRTNYGSAGVIVCGDVIEGRWDSHPRSATGLVIRWIDRDLVLADSGRQRHVAQRCASALWEDGRRACVRACACRSRRTGWALQQRYVSTYVRIGREDADRVLRFHRRVLVAVGGLSILARRLMG